MSRPRLLDLFCCAGGAAMGYHRAGFEVVGVDKDPQPNYPFEFVQGDALELGPALLASGRFQAAHGSAPCQTFTAYRRRGARVGDGYLNLIPETRAMFERSGLPYVIENVEGAPLRDPVMLCGSAFGLDVRRHRLFEVNFPMMSPGCVHGWQRSRFAPATNRTNLRRTVEIGVWRIPLDVQQQAMGMDWSTLEELSEAVPPAYTEHIGDYLFDHLGSIAA